MRTMVPEDYGSFRCIAEKCRHSCCIGWEIDIDAESLRRYRSIPGDMGRRLQAVICVGPEGAFFRMGEDGRCPLLNPSGLCDLITEQGESSLCQICADHPRYRSFFADRTEIGLGLCCEAAAMLLLSREDPFRLVCLEDDGLREPLPEEEADLLAIRENAFALLRRRELPLPQRLDELLAFADFPAGLGSLAAWAALYRRLERLDPQWDPLLDALTGDWAHPASLDVPLEQFCANLLYRHLPGALEDEDVPGRIAFAVLNARILATLCCKNGIQDVFGLAELARMWSAEIEYNEENVSAILDVLWELAHGQAGEDML